MRNREQVRGKNIFRAREKAPEALHQHLPAPNQPHLYFSTQVHTKLHKHETHILPQTGIVIYSLTLFIPNIHT